MSLSRVKSQNNHNPLPPWSTSAIKERLLHTRMHVLAHSNSMATGFELLAAIFPNAEYETPVQWGLCEYVILRVQIETRWVARVLAGTFLSQMAGRSLPFQCFHSPVRFLFFFFSEPWKVRQPLQLSLTPTLTLHTWISFHFFGGRQRSPLGLYHSLHNHLRHPDDRRPGKKREACLCRSCPWLLTGVTEQGNGKLSTSFLGGIPRCS